MRRGWLVLGVLAITVSALPARAAEPPPEPVLRLETGMHTTSIPRIGGQASRNRIGRQVGRIVVPARKSAPLSSG